MSSCLCQRRTTGVPLLMDSSKSGIFRIVWDPLTGSTSSSRLPPTPDSLYYNYKHTFSIVLLAVVDANLIFRMVDVGGYGRNSDGGTLSNSPFGQALRDGTLDLPEDRVIPGAEDRGPMPCLCGG